MRTAKLVYLVIILSSLLLLLPTVSADLPLIYQSEDKDLLGAPDLNNVDNITNEYLAQYYDYVFSMIPSIVESQNEKFIWNFPETRNDKSAAPYGTLTESRGVIKDAYLKLIPVKGFVKIGSEFVADKTVKVGYLLDYRIKLPPDITDHYPKHYYRLVKSRVDVEICSGDNIKKSSAKKDIIEIGVKGDITAKAVITAEVEETIIELHTSCETVCDENGNCSTHCYQYEVKYTRMHIHTLELTDRITILESEKPIIYALIDENNRPREYWIEPGKTTSAIATNEGGSLRTILYGIQYYATYRYITQVTYYTEGHSWTTTLSEPAYYIVAVPSYNLLPSLECVIMNVIGETVNSSKDVPNFKPTLPLTRITALRIKFNGNITPLNFFGNKEDFDLRVKRIVPAEVSPNIAKKDSKYIVTLHITYNGIKYNGPILITFRAQSFNATVNDGTLVLEFNRSGALKYYIPSNVPNDWFKRPETVFLDNSAGEIYVGEKQDTYTLAINQFVLILSAAVPFIAFYYVLKKFILGGEEEEEYL